MHRLLIAYCPLESLQSRCKAHQQFYVEKIYNATFTALSVQWIFFKVLIQLLLKIILLKRTFDLLN